MRRWIVSLLAVGLAFAGLAVSAQPAGANHSWGSYHWARTANPFTIQLGDNLTTNWDAHLVTASADWAQSSVLNTTVTAGSTSPKTCKPRGGRVEVCNAKYGRNGWLGIAQIWASGSHITQGVVKLNDTYFNTASYNKPAWRALVTCQEIGHTFGLGHQDENFNNANLNTCMDYTSNPESNQHPNAHDYQLLETIYAHLDTTTTIAASASPAGNSQSDWGRAIGKGGPNGQADEYEKDLGDGQTLITHVFWADADHVHDH